MSILIETAYLPPIGYMAEVAAAGSAVIELFETYTKQTCRNRAEIYGPNGKQTLSIPVIKINGNKTITKDIRLSDHQPWQKIHLRSIETAYNNSPFFLYYQDDLAPFYEKKFVFLADWNHELLAKLLHILKAGCTLQFSDHFDKVPAGIDDKRNGPVLKHVTSLSRFPRYTQVFEPRHGFLPGLSIIDLLFNLGPETASYLEALKTDLPKNNVPE